MIWSIKIKIQAPDILSEALKPETKEETQRGKVFKLYLSEIIENSHQVFAQDYKTEMLLKMNSLRSLEMMKLGRINATSTARELVPLSIAAT